MYIYKQAHMILSSANKGRASVMKPLSSLKSHTDYATPARDSIDTALLEAAPAHLHTTPRARGPRASHYVDYNNV